MVVVVVVTVVVVVVQAYQSETLGRQSVAVVVVVVVVVLVVVVVWSGLTPAQHSGARALGLTGRGAAADKVDQAGRGLGMAVSGGGRGRHV